MALSFEGSLVGMRFRPPALEITQSLKPGDKLLARREPDNAYDPNAIAIFLDPAQFDTVEDRNAAALLESLAQELAWPEVPDLPLQLGYINREAAEVISGQMDQSGVSEVECIHQLSFSGKPIVKVNLEELE